MNAANAQQSTLDKTQEYQRAIGSIGEEIDKVSRNLNANRALVASQRDELFEAEQSLVKSKRVLQQIEYELAKNQHEFDALSLQIKKVQESQNINREALRSLIKNRFYQGKPDYFKSLLNQENPYAVGRLNNYHNYFSSALEQRFALLGQKALEFEKLSQKQSEVIRVLAEKRKKQKTQETVLEKSKDERAAAIAKLDQKIASSAQTLSKLKNDRQRLSSLLAVLKKKAAELKRLEELKAKQEAEERKRQIANNQVDKKPAKRPIVKGGFLKQKGRLSNPVSGKLVRKFGSRLAESGMRSEGTFFATNGSVPVKSIFRGRVLFADFLKGYGLLIIVDHGDDHISLYGHNDSLLKKVGDKVSSNETIAKSGVTGGLKSHGLYFEIRDNATPVDTSKWCR